MVDSGLNYVQTLSMTNGEHSTTLQLAASIATNDATVRVVEHLPATCEARVSGCVLCIGAKSALPEYASRRSWLCSWPTLEIA